MKKLNKKGFTLIEMLVVIAIIAILVAIIIPTVSNATEKAKEATDVANIRSLVAQYQIQNLNDDDGLDDTIDALLACDSSADSCSLKSKATCTVEGDENGITSVEFVANILKDGNDPDGDEKTYVWELGDLLTESDGD